MEKESIEIKDIEHYFNSLTDNDFDIKIEYLDTNTYIQVDLKNKENVKINIYTLEDIYETIGRLSQNYIIVSSTIETSLQDNSFLVSLLICEDFTENEFIEIIISDTFNDDMTKLYITSIKKNDTKHDFFYSISGYLENSEFIYYLVIISVNGEINIISSYEEDFAVDISIDDENINKVQNLYKKLFK